MLPWIADKNISGKFAWWTTVIMLTDEHCAFLNTVNIKLKHPFQWQHNTEELIHRTNYTNYFDISSSDDSLQFLIAFQSDAYSLIFQSIHLLWPDMTLNMYYVTEISASASVCACVCVRMCGQAMQ